MITYHTDVRPNAQVIADLYREASLIRPVDDVDRIRRMYAGANVVASAFDGDRLVGILRGWTDDAFDGYVCDLAVLPGYQSQGIGARLLEVVRQNRPDVQWVLRASKIAAEYYGHLGWKKIENGWFWPREN